MAELDVSFRPMAFDDLPGWMDDDHLAALRAFIRSCGPLLESEGEGRVNLRTPPPSGLLAACRHARSMRRPTPTEAQAFFESHFTPHKVVHGDASGLLTGYYEPMLDGSRERGGDFQVPIYRRPPELVNLVDDTMRGANGETLTHARRTPTGVEPYFTRAEIESGSLDGRSLELVFLSDPVDVFFMQVQGSGSIRLTDGSTIRVSYDGKNGHPYRSIGRSLIDSGDISAEDMSLRTLSEWLRADLSRGQQVMRQNPSFVFFRELDGAQADQPMGVMRIPLSEGRSLAVDASVHAIGAPIYVVSPSLRHTPDGGPFQRLMIAQDVGSAIRGPERGDIYYGSGDDAGRLAGVTKHQGNFLVFLTQEPGSRDHLDVTSERRDTDPGSKAARRRQP